MPVRAWRTRIDHLQGFDVLYATTEGFELGQASDNTVKQALSFYGVRYDVLLQFTDTLFVHKALQDGIGLAEAFGFGALSVSRLH